MIPFIRQKLQRIYVHRAFRYMLTYTTEYFDTVAVEWVPVQHTRSFPWLWLALAWMKYRKNDWIWYAVKAPAMIVDRHDLQIRYVLTTHLEQARIQKIN